ncbi:MAG: hypothetical protein CALGDGBN_01729 [Pseudomonadales bacterium]|nr:hypothetical protein [Pseudomonadales bacterium]
MPGTAPITASNTAETASARGESNICPSTCSPMSRAALTRVTMIAAVVESSREGICATSPSPMVSSE